MAHLNIPEQLAIRLQRLAEREHQSIETLIESLLDQYDAETAPAQNPMLAMLELAEEANLQFSDNTITERSRKILSTEYTDHLLERMHDDDDDDDALTLDDYPSVTH